MMSDEAQNMFEMISTALNVDKTAKFKVSETSVNKIPDEKTKILRVDGFNPKNNNTLITNYYQLGLGSMHNHMLLDVGKAFLNFTAREKLSTVTAYTLMSLL